MQAIRAGPVVFEGTEQVSIGDPEDSAFTVARADAGVPASAFFGMEHPDCDASGIDFKVHVALDALDDDLARLRPPQ